MQPLEDAQKHILAHAKPVPGTLTPLEQAAGLCLAQDISSPHPMPPFDNSAMDGYALRQHAKNTYQILDHVPAGQVSQVQLEAGQGVKIMTGAPVPESADTVVPIEVVQVLDIHTIEVQEPPTSGQHIRRAGEEVAQNEVILKTGHRLHAGSIGLLASLGLGQVSVRHPRVTVLATGSELLPLDAPLEPGKIRDSNSPALATSLRAMGLSPEVKGIVEDSKDALEAALKVALENTNVLLTSGGVSVGDHDYVQELLLKLGMKKHFWKVGIKPGKPVLFGTLNQTLIFGIPGNPGSALTVFEYLIRPALRQMMGYQTLWRPQKTGVLSQDVKPAHGRLHLMRVHYEDTSTGPVVTPLKSQGSSNLLTVSMANAILPVHRAYQAGEEVQIDCIFEPENH